MKKFLLAGNWKMNTTLLEGVDIFRQLNIALLELDGKTDPLHEEDSILNSGVEIVLCPPFTHLSTLQEIQSRYLRLGAQNCSSEAKGAFTGEISAEMLNSMRIHYVIVGHSERRLYFQEKEELLAKKVDLSLENDLIPIFCIGETRQERESGEYLMVLKHQMEKSIFHLSPEKFSSVVIAYEPIWAIGTGLTASPDEAQEVHGYIRKIILEKYGKKVSDALRILYGGSLQEKNAANLFDKPDIDGGLVGGASLKPLEFIQIIKALVHAKQEK